MENLLGDYQCQFSVEERKQLVAQMIQETRKAKKCFISLCLKINAFGLAGKHGVGYWKTWRALLAK